MGGRRSPDPSDRTQNRKGVEEGSHVHAVDRFVSLYPRPFLFLVLNQGRLAIGLDRQLVDVIRFEAKDRQFLPLQRIGKNIGEKSSMDRHDEGLVTQAGEDVFTFDLTERNGR